MRTVALAAALATLPLAAGAQGAPACGDLAACETTCATCTETCPQATAAACHAVGEHRLHGKDTFDLALAAGAFDTACTHGHAEACSALALQVQDGRGVPHDPDRAAALYGRACESGAGVGCFNLGLMYQGAALGVADAARAATWFARAAETYRGRCDAGEGEDCMLLGVLHEGGYGMPVDPVAAHGLYVASCEAGFPDGCTNAVLVELDGVVPLAGEPVARLKTSCEAGGSFACATAGRLLAFGRSGVSTDLAAALPLLERGCMEGIGDACGALASLLSQAGPDPLAVERAAWYDARACDLGQSAACLVLGLQELDGATPERGVPWLERTCDIGAPEGCYHLAGLACRGLAGVATDRCRPLTREACRKGMRDACVALLAWGEPLPVPAEAQPGLREQACSLGVTSACAAPAP